jgi:ubiquinol-cytochrome c reductase cytochrome b subunit
MLVGVFEFSHLFPPKLAILPIFVLPGVVLLVVLAMPFLARSVVGQLFNLGFAGAVVVGLIGLTWHSYDKDRQSAAHQAAIAAEDDLAHRARELAAGQGIPSSGALTLLRNDAKVQGPKLFKQHCASCHNYSAPAGKEILAEKPSAPELYRFATRQWIAGLLQPATVAGPDYFGNTAFRDEKDGMVDTVKAWWKEVAGDKEELANLKNDLDQAALALSAEAQLKSQRDIDDAAAAQIKAGQGTINAMCVDCHRFHDAPGVGKPDLTGYGSRDWLRGIIANPAHPRFYGKTNDRMPAYQDIITSREIDLVADWLRGEWFETEQE